MILFLPYEGIQPMKWTHYWTFPFSHSDFIWQSGYSCKTYGHRGFLLDVFSDLGLSVDENAHRGLQGQRLNDQVINVKCHVLLGHQQSQLVPFLIKQLHYIFFIMHKTMQCYFNDANPSKNKRQKSFSSLPWTCGGKTSPFAFRWAPDWSLWTWRCGPLRLGSPPSAVSHPASVFSTRPTPPSSLSLCTSAWPRRRRTGGAHQERGSWGGGGQESWGQWALWYPGAGEPKHDVPCSFAQVEPRGHGVGLGAVKRSCSQFSLFSQIQIEQQVKTLLVPTVYGNSCGADGLYREQRGGEDEQVKQDYRLWRGDTDLHTASAGWPVWSWK